MAQKADFYTYINEKIATPLAAAAEEHALKKGQSFDGEDMAKNIASLLPKITMLSIKAIDKMSLSETDEAEADKLRLGMAAVATPLIANHFRMKGEAPANADIDKFAMLMQTVSQFGESFKIADGALSNIKTIDGVIVEGDDNLLRLQHLQIFAPIMATIQTFSFGQPEQKTLQDAVDRITAKATRLRKDILPDLAENKVVFAELSLMRTLALLFTQAYMGQMARLVSAGQSGGTPDVTLDDVWEQFDKNIKMIDALTTGFFAKVEKAQPATIAEPEKVTPEPASQVAPVKETEPQPAIADAEPETPAATPEPEVKKQEEPAPAASEVDGDKDVSSEGSDESGKDPMSFFVKKA